VTAKPLAAFALLSCALLPLALVLGACSGPGSSSGSPGAGGEPRAYPFELRQEQTLDIQVFLNPSTIEFTNTTATAFGPSRVWLNQRYGRDIDGLDVGETLVLDLETFRDRFGDPFPGGGFFATELPERLVLAQLETELDAGVGGSSSILLGMVAIEEIE